MNTPSVVSCTLCVVNYAEASDPTGLISNPNERQTLKERISLNCFKTSSIPLFLTGGIPNDDGLNTHSRSSVIRANVSSLELASSTLRNLRNMSLRAIGDGG